MSRALVSSLLTALTPPVLAQRAAAVLPNSPGAITLEGKSTGQDATGVTRPVVASNHAKFIFPDQTASQLSSKDKFYIGLIHGISVYSASGWVIAAEYEHVRDGAPNYGVDLGAYGQRLGGAALRGYSEEVLGTSILAPLLHEDPRFFRMGPRRGVGARIGYAITRTIITRNDTGHQTANLSLLGGNLTGAALTNAYYPARNRSLTQTFQTYGGSMGGAAFGFLVDEFLPDQLLRDTVRSIHLKHR